MAGPFIEMEIGKQETNFGFLRSNRVSQRIALARLLMFSVSLFNAFNKFATHLLEEAVESRWVEEVGRWLPQCSCLPTPVGSEETFPSQKFVICANRNNVNSVWYFS